MSTSEESKVPHRQIRALYDDKTITVYQAYSASIAQSAVKAQKLNASPDFLPGRMTWIKPSWCWMMYRSGYSTKDAYQSRILAIKMTHENFQHLLSLAAVTHGQNGGLSAEEKARPVRVQWDPERSPRMGMLAYRSIQIGISRELSSRWVEEWIEGIEDVTERALGLKEAVEVDAGWSLESLVARDLMPVEKVYGIPRELMEVLKMT